MRKFLRLMMLALMVAYGAQGWGAYVKFNGKDSWSGTSASKTNDGVTINLTLANGTFSSGKFGRFSTAKSFKIPKGATFTIKSGTSGAKIVYIAFSFDNGYVGNSQNNSNNDWQITKGGGSKHSTSNYKGHGDWWSQSYWEKDDSSDGESEVVFYNGNGNGTRLLWMYVYVVKSSETTASKVSLEVNGTERFESESSFTITTTSGNNVYYTTDGSTPTTSSANGKTGTTGPVDKSCVVRAGTYTTFNPVSDNDGDDKPESGNSSVKKWYYSDKKVFTRYYKRDISTNKYTTLVFPTALKVSQKCTWAAACTYDKANARVTIPNSGDAGRYSKGQIIPANTPVLVYAPVTKADTCQFDWINTYNGESAAASPSSNNLEGNNSSSDQTPGTTSGYKYFGLMAPTAAQKARGLSFGFYQFSYDGTFGNVKIPAYRAYLKVATSELKANAAKEGISFGFFDDDDNNTTGISVVPTTTNGASDRQVQSAVRYNLSGQQVGPDYKGIVIVNGRKMVVK